MSRIRRPTLVPLLRPAKTGPTLDPAPFPYGDHQEQAGCGHVELQWRRMGGKRPQAEQGEEKAGEVRARPPACGAGQPLEGHGPPDEQQTAAEQRNDQGGRAVRSEEHTSELQSLMRISYAVFCLKKNTRITVIDKPRLCPHRTEHRLQHMF